MHVYINIAYLCSIRIGVNHFPRWIELTILQNKKRMIQFWNMNDGKTEGHTNNRKYENGKQNATNIHQYIDIYIFFVFFTIYISFVALYMLKAAIIRRKDMLQCLDNVIGQWQADIERWMTEIVDKICQSFHVRGTFFRQCWRIASRKLESIVCWQ